MSSKRTPDAAAPCASVPLHPAFGTGGVEIPQSRAGGLGGVPLVPRLLDLRCQRTFMETGNGKPETGKWVVNELIKVNQTDRDEI